MDVITKQQKACAKYYLSLCQVIDRYSDTKRKSNITQQILKQPFFECSNILKNAKNENKPIFNISAYLQLSTNFYVFSAFIRGLGVHTPTIEHPLLSEIKNLLQMCIDCITILPVFWTKSNSNVNQRNEISLPRTLSDIDINLLYSCICLMLESILDIFGNNTQSMIATIVQTIVQILKCTQSQASAKLLLKVISIYVVNEKNGGIVGGQFIQLMSDIILFFSSAVDISNCGLTVNEIYHCILKLIEMNKKSKEVWCHLLPISISLALKSMTKNQSSEGIIHGCKFLQSLFNPVQYRKRWSKNVTPELKLKIFPSIVNVLFEGIADKFQRGCISDASKAYYNVMQCNMELVFNHTQEICNKLSSSMGEHEQNRNLFLETFHVQRNNPQKFLMVLHALHNICHMNEDMECLRPFLISHQPQIIILE